MCVGQRGGGGGGGSAAAAAAANAAAVWLAVSACLVLAAAAVAAATVAMLWGLRGGGEEENYGVKNSIAGIGGRSGLREINILLLPDLRSTDEWPLLTRDDEQCHMCNFHTFSPNSSKNFDLHFDAAVVLAGQEEVIEESAAANARVKLWGRLITDPGRQKLLNSHKNDRDTSFDFSVSYLPGSEVKLFEWKFRRRKTVKDDSGEMRRRRRKRKASVSSPGSRVAAAIMDRCETPSNREGFLQEASIQEIIGQTLFPQVCLQIDFSKKVSRHCERKNMCRVC